MHHRPLFSSLTVLACAVSSYPLALINTFVSGGLLFIHIPDIWLPKGLQALRASYAWSPPFRTWTPVVLFFFLSNVFLVGVPLIPPSRGYQVYEHLPYWVSLAHVRPAPLPTPPLTRFCLLRFPLGAVPRTGGLADIGLRRGVLVRVVRVAPAARGLHARAGLGAGRRRVDAARRAAGAAGISCGAWELGSGYVTVGARVWGNMTALDPAGCGHLCLRSWQICRRWRVGVCRLKKLRVCGECLDAGVRLERGSSWLWDAVRRV